MPPTETRETQRAAIQRLALSLDSFLVNGIPFGVLLPEGFARGFLQMVADSLLRDLAGLQNATGASPLLASLDERCRELIDTVTGLRGFAALSRRQLRDSVARVRPLRDECVRRLVAVEESLGIEPSLDANPTESAPLVDGFLANLDSAFAEAWGKAQTLAGSPS